MKDRHAILFLSILLAILLQLSEEIAHFDNNWAVLNPIVITILSCVVLTVIQRRNQNTFLQHLLKALKIVSLLLILYVPII